MSGNQLKTLRGVENMIKLETLQCNNNKVMCLSQLKNLHKLHQLDLRKNWILDEAEFQFVCNKEDVLSEGNPFELNSYNCVSFYLRDEMERIPIVF